MRGLCPVLASIAALTFLAGVAHANGRFPAANQLVISPSDSNLLILRSTFGLLLSHNHGVDWDWICEDAYLTPLSTDPALGVTQKNALILGTFNGVVASLDTGCSWGRVPSLQGQYLPDAVVRPDDPHTALVISSTFIGDGGADNRVVRSSNDGVDWVSWGSAIDPEWTVQTIEVAYSDPHRIYVSATKGALPNIQSSLLVSVDDGLSWTPRPIPIDGVTEHGAFIGAVDPTNPDRVYVRTGGDRSDVSLQTSSRLLVTEDAGKSFRTVLTFAGQMLGFALSPDGRQVFVGGVADGLFAANTSDFTFAQKSKVHVQCLRATTTELWACSDEASGFILGVSTDGGTTFAPRLHLSGIRQVLQCEPTSSTAACEPSFPALCKSFKGCADSDSGVHPNPAPVSSSCGCQVVADERTIGAVCLMVAGVLGVFIQRRSRNRLR